MSQDPSSQTQDPHGHLRYHIAATGEVLRQSLSPPPHLPLPSLCLSPWLCPGQVLSFPSFRVWLRGALLTVEKPALPGSPRPVSGSLRLTMLVLHTGSESLGASLLKGSSWQPSLPGLKGPKGPLFPPPACHGLPLSPGLSVPPELTAAPWTLAQVCTPRGARTTGLEHPGPQKALRSFYVSGHENGVRECSPGDYSHFTLQ